MTRWTMPGSIVASAMLAISLFAFACDDTGSASDPEVATPRGDVTRFAGGGEATADDPRSGGATPSTTRGRDAQPLLPDLRVLPMREMYIEPGATPGSRVLRFSTTVMNDGDGPLSLVASVDPETGDIVAIQRVTFDDGSEGERTVGRFAFEGMHAHWHLQDFMVLNIRKVDGDGEPAGTVASTGKATFCAVDEVPERDDAPPPAFLSCAEPEQGISRGWSDTYSAALPGQEIDISTLTNGVYALQTIVDPDDRLMEADEDNNDAFEHVRIEGVTITAVEP